MHQGWQNNLEMFPDPRTMPPFTQRSRSLPDARHTLIPVYADPQASFIRQ